MVTSEKEGAYNAYTALASNLEVQVEVLSAGKSDTRGFTAGSEKAGGF